ncbi:MAG: hypothetical protein ACOVNL_04100 [Prochlorococcaceae cyanobacterium]|jgi:hypothetical protein
MNRPFPWIWVFILGLLVLAPTPAGRVLLDVLGGLTLGLLLLPVLAGAGIWIAWQVLRRRLQICPACGSASLARDICPVCGASLTATPDSIQVNLTDLPGVGEPATGGLDASSMTIDVAAQEVDDR